MDWIMFHCFPLLLLEQFFERIIDAPSISSIKYIFSFYLYDLMPIFPYAFLKQNQIYLLFQNIPRWKSTPCLG